ncbi:MAG TPA: hypothetical protein VF137_10495 [Candidatus Dormibacteraeota bacterium]
MIRLNPRRALTLFAVGLALSACGPSGFEVGMERLISNVVFGFQQPKPAEQPQAPFLPPPSLPLLPATFPFGNPLAPAAQEPCPTAPPGTPGEAATTNVDKAAKNGLYKWFSSYQRTPTGGTGSTSSGFETRKIQGAKYDGTDVASAGAQTSYVYEWTSVQPDPFQQGYVDVLSFQSHSYSNLDNPPGTAVETPQSSGNYDPYGGIDLTDLKRYDATNKLVEEFAPTSGSQTIGGQTFSGTPGLLIFTLPVPGVSAGPPLIGNPPYQGQYPPTPLPYPPYAPGDNRFSWQATASDSAHQWTEVITAFEGNQRVVVDACGSVVDAWPMTTTLQITKNNPDTSLPYTAPLTLTWNFDVAPQFGGLIVYQTIQGDGGYGDTVKTQELLGSLQVAPLPKGS